MIKILLQSAQHRSLFGLLGLGGGEIIMILFALLVLAATTAGTIALVVWLIRQNKKPATPPSAPPIIPLSSTRRACPQCGKELPAHAPEGLCPACVMRVGLGSQSGTQSESPPIPPPAPTDIAQHFPQLEILELLGQGGMGMVYKARQRNLERIVALKILRTDNRRDPAFAERFAREAKALARLNHPNIVTIHDFGEVDGFYFLLMEFVDGVNLRELYRERKLKPEEALQIVPPICDALQFAHQQGIVHRDIKPENILVDKQGRVKIADFGIAKILGTDKPTQPLTGDRQAIGTPHYMAPEQVEKPTTVDHRADIYSLGVVFYEMLTGELPLGRFAAPSHKVQIDVRLDDIVLRALEKEPERRYQQASEIKTQVETIATSAGQISGGEQRAASSSARSEIPQATPAIELSASTSPPRFSKMAIAGALWAPFALICLLGLFGLYSVHTVSNGQPSAPVGIPNRSFLILLFLPFGLTAPFGTTILGCLAISKIRHSSGRLHGLGLALFDALLFPLLALAGAIFFGSFAMVKLFSLSPMIPHWLQNDGALILIWVSLGLLATFVIEFFIVRAAWHAVNKPLAGSTPMTSGTESEAQKPALEPIPWWAQPKDRSQSDWRQYVQPKSPAASESAAMAPPPIIERRGVRSFLWLVLGLCALNFIWPHAVTLGDAAHRAITIGGTQPWMGSYPQVLANGETVRQRFLNPAASSFLGGIAAVIIAIVLLWQAPGVQGTTSGNRGRKMVAVLLLILAVGASLFVLQPRQMDSKAIAGNTSESADVRYRIFEAEAALVDRLVPSDTRQRGDMPDSDEISGRTKRVGSPASAVSQMAEINAATLTALLNGMSAEPGILVDRQRNVPFAFWPRLADGQSYSRPNGVGSMNGFVALRRNDGVYRLRVQYHVTHLVDVRDGVNAEIFYEGNAPQPGLARAFFIPITKENGSTAYLVIVFEIPVAAESSEQGGTVRIVAIGQPSRQPNQWWDLNGQPVPTHPAWLEFAAKAQFAVAIDRLGVEGIVDGDLLTPDAARIALSSGVAGSSDFGPGRDLYHFSDNSSGQFRHYLDHGGRVDFVVKNGTGPWQEIGPIVEGQTVELDGGRFTLAKVEARGDKVTNWIGRTNYPGLIFLTGTYNYDSAFEIAWIAVDKNGRRSRVSDSTGIGPYAARENREVNHFLDMEKNDVSHFLILKRPVTKQVFTNIPTEMKSATSAKLTTGAVVTLLAVENHHSQPDGQSDEWRHSDGEDEKVAWWKPDGSEIGEPVRSVVTSRKESRPLRGYWFSVLVSNAPDESLLTETWVAKIGRAQIRPDSGLAGKMEKSSELGGTLFHFADTGLKNESTTQVRFGFAVRPRRTMLVWEGKPLKLVQNNWPGAPAMEDIAIHPFKSRHYQEYNPWHGEAYRTNAGSMIQIKVPETETSEWMWHLEITDQQGGEHVYYYGGRDINEEGRWWGAILWEVDVVPSEIRSIRLLGHRLDEDYCWTDFPDVVLNRSNAVRNDSANPALLKPVPRETAKLLATTKAALATFAEEHDMTQTNAIREFQKELDVHTRKIKDLLQGTSAEPLVKQQDELLMEIKNASQAKDTNRVHQLSAELQAIGKNIEKMIGAPIPAGQE